MDGMEKLIADLAQDCLEKGLTTAKEVRRNVFGIVWADYKGKAPRWKVEAVCDDLTESVCLKTGIPHDA